MEGARVERVAAPSSLPSPRKNGEREKRRCSPLSLLTWRKRVRTGWARRRGDLASERADGGSAGLREHKFSDGPDEGVEAVGAVAVGEAVGGEVAHLALEFGKSTDVDDAAFRIQN